MQDVIFEILYKCAVQIIMSNAEMLVFEETPFKSQAKIKNPRGVAPRILGEGYNPPLIWRTRWTPTNFPLAGFRPRERLRTNPLCERAAGIIIYTYPVWAVQAKIHARHVSGGGRVQERQGNCIALLEVFG